MATGHMSETGSGLLAHLVNGAALAQLTTAVCLGIVEFTAWTLAVGRLLERIPLAHVLFGFLWFPMASYGFSMFCVLCISLGFLLVSCAFLSFLVEFLVFGVCLPLDLQFVWNLCFVSVFFAAGGV